MKRPKIAIGKIGKSIKLSNDKGHPAIGGGIETTNTLLTLIKNNPDMDFWVVGPCQEVPNDLPNLFQINLKCKEIGDSVREMDKWLEANPDIKFDCGVIFSGSVSNNFNCHPKSLNAKGELKKTFYVYSRYAGVYLNFLNQTNIPWLMLYTDPRTMNKWTIRDMCNKPHTIMSQYSEKQTLYSYAKDPSNYTEVVAKDYDIKYSGIETAVLIGQENRRGKFDKNTKSIEMTILCHEGAPSRYNQLNEYILESMPDVSIYGKWDHSETILDDRFKGAIKFNELANVLRSTKYTFLIPILDGWCTAKFWEMIHLGVIPFLHPTYDTQMNIKCPDFLRVNSPQELYEKIEMLNEDEDLYDEITSQLNDMLTPELYSGKMVNNMIVNWIKTVL
jgi:hypothetical protein